jgi:hypothetical protein
LKASSAQILVLLVLVVDHVGQVALLDAHLLEEQTFVALVLAQPELM